VKLRWWKVGVDAEGMNFVMSREYFIELPQILPMNTEKTVIMIDN